MDLFETSRELVMRFINKDLSPRYHFDKTLQRIKQLDPTLHAFIAIYEEEARADADAAERAVKRGYPLGPFTGVPFALKDIVDVAGRETTGGSAALRRSVPKRNAVITDRLLSAGGILIGKTHTVEVAMGGWGTNQRLGTPVNPWDLTVHRTPGGSSSGSGVAVAAGLVPFAIGSDTGGSVRLPAAWNGIVGLKVTEGTIPLEGIIPLAHTLDTPGPLARSVEDCTIGLEILSGKEQRTILIDMLEERGLYAYLTRGVRGLVIAAMPAIERDGVDTEVLTAYDKSLEQLAAEGAIVKPVSLPRRFDYYQHLTGIIISAEGYFYHGKIFDDPDAPVDEDVRPRILSGRSLSAQEYLKAVRGRHDDQAAFMKALSGCDVLVTPTIATAAIPLNEVDQSTTPALFTRAANYLGLCAVTVPNGLTASGLPTSFQIIGRPHSEPLILRIAANLERFAGGCFPIPNVEKLARD